MAKLLSLMSWYAEAGLIVLSWAGGLIMVAIAIALGGSVSFLFAALAALVLAIAAVRTAQLVVRTVRRARERGVSA